MRGRSGSVVPRWLTGKSTAVFWRCRPSDREAPWDAENRWTLRSGVWRPRSSKVTMDETSGALPARPRAPHSEAFSGFSARNKAPQGGEFRRFFLNQCPGPPLLSWPSPAKGASALSGSSEELSLEGKVDQQRRLSREGTTRLKQTFPSVESAFCFQRPLIGGPIPSPAVCRVATPASL